MVALLKSRIASRANEAFKTEFGEESAHYELFCAISNYLCPRRILEIGCGAGRNIKALLRFYDSQYVGIDLSEAQLGSAKIHLKSFDIAERKRVSLLVADACSLPFDDSEFDLVILWQVLEHLSRRAQESAVSEATRVVKNGGHMLIATPNYLFPFDYHDTFLPLVHWFLPDRIRRTLCRIRRGWEANSNYVTFRGIFRLIPSNISAQKVSEVYLYSSYDEIIKNLSGSLLFAKRVFFSAYRPVYSVMKTLGIQAGAFLPSLRVLLKIEKRGVSRKASRIAEDQVIALSQGLEK